MEDRMPGPDGPAARPVARVLIVDDEESIRRLVSKWSDVSGYQVKAASSAEAALLMMHAWTADIVVCDIRMPRYSGVWLIEHLRTLYPSTAIIISPTIVRRSSRRSSARWKRAKRPSRPSTSSRWFERSAIRGFAVHQFEVLWFEPANGEP